MASCDSYVPPGGRLSESMPPEGEVRLLSESLACAFHDATFTQWALFAPARTGDAEKWSAAELHPCELLRHPSAHGMLVGTAFALEQ